MRAVRASALVHARVDDVEGRRVGRVHDVVAGRPGLTVEQLIVAPAGVLERLGLSHAHRPRPRLVEWLLRKERVVDWGAVASFDAGRVRLSVAKEDLARRSD
jgi:sporulation protein YlmC with PRC-barrel domain